MIRSTGRVIRRATASPVSMASSAASPAAPAMARSSAVCSAWSALARPEPVNRTSACPARSPRTTIAVPVAGPAGWRGEAGRGRDHRSLPVADLDVGAGLPGQIQHRGQVGGGPAVVLVPRRARRHRDRVGQLGVLPGGQGRDIGRGEPRGQPGHQGDGRQGDRDEGQRQPQAKGGAARRGDRRRAAAISHRGRGPAGTRRPSRSARSGAGPDHPRSCGAGSSRASRRSAHTPRTHTRGPG